MSLISADHQPHAAKKLIAGVLLFRKSYPGTTCHRETLPMQQAQIAPAARSRTASYRHHLRRPYRRFGVLGY
jgi:hypothetical protein